MPSDWFIANRRTMTLDAGSLPVRCVFQSTHTVRKPFDEMAQHYINSHGAADTPLTSAHEDIQDGKSGGYAGKDDQGSWETRQEKVCPICAHHGVVALYRRRLTANEVNAGDSLQTHIVDFHGGS